MCTATQFSTFQMRCESIHQKVRLNANDENCWRTHTFAKPTGSIAATEKSTHRWNATIQNDGIDFRTQLKWVVPFSVHCKFYGYEDVLKINLKLWQIKRWNLLIYPLFSWQSIRLQITRSHTNRFYFQMKTIILWIIETFFPFCSWGLTTTDNVHLHRNRLLCSLLWKTCDFNLLNQF